MLVHTLYYSAHVTELGQSLGLVFSAGLAMSRGRVKM